MKQRDNYTDFLHTFRNIVNELDDYPEKELLYVFTAAVSPKLRTEILTKNVETIEDAISIATICDAADSRNMSYSSNYLRKVNYSKIQFPKQHKYPQKSFLQKTFRK